jgi:hypothetical protein
MMTRLEEWEMKGDELGNFIVYSESMNRDIKLIGPTILRCAFISQKEQRHQANPSLRATCTLIGSSKKEYSNEAPPPVETWLSSFSFPFCTTTIKLALSL